MKTPLIAALAATAFPFSAFAGITGTFVAAQDGVNSFQSVDGVTLFSSTAATPGLWHDRPGVFDIASIPGSGAYQGQDKSGASTHNEVVTTLTGLAPGTSYEIRMIMGINTSATSGTQHIDAGFASGALTTLLESGGTSTGLSLAAGGTWVAVEQLIGTVIADPSGEVKVYVDATLNAERSVYNGLSYIVSGSVEPPDFVTERTIASPDGALVFQLERDQSTDKLAWSVTHGGRAVVTRGVLGIDISGTGVVGDEGTIGDVAARAVDTSWTPPYGERAIIPDHFNEETLTIADVGNGSLTVRLQVRAYDEGIALRYLVDGTGTLTVASEQTSFPLPATTQVWVSSAAQGVISKRVIGSVSGAVERPVTAEIAPDLFAALGEAGLVNHARMKFVRSGTSTLVPSLSGTSTYTDTLATPWRYVRAASSPAALLQGNHIMLNLNEPSQVADTSWIRPGKVLREITLTTRGAMASVDFAATHGLDFVHFDAGWYGPEGSSSSDATTVTVDPARSPGPLDLPGVIARAKAKGIGVILYVNRRALETQLDEILPLYQSWGVDGIKFGFVNVGSQQWTHWLHDAIAQCAGHEIMVNVHDEYRMTGVERTLPNFMTSEGIRGDEESPKNEDVLRTIFTRSLAGAGDQTNVYFDQRVANMGSHASQMAKTICVYSPWQYVYWYDRPAESPAPVGTGTATAVIQEVPELSFFKRLPTVWDETRVLDGYPGTHATIARRKGDIWFLGTLNGAAARNFTVPLDFLAAGRNYKLELFSDDAAVATVTKVRVETSTVDRTAVIDLSVAARNGFAAILTPTDGTPPPPSPTTMTFKQGADIVSNDGLFDVPGYQGVDDTSLVQESPDNNFGGRDSLLVGVVGGGMVRDALLRYDLSAIAGEYSTIDSMKLRLHVDAFTDPAAWLEMNVALERAGNAGWVAGTGDNQLQDGSATWNHAARTGTQWLGGANGARGSADLHGVMGNAIVAENTAAVGSWIEIDLTPVADDPDADTLTKVVDMWTRNSGADNAGMLLVYQSMADDPQWTFSSSDHPTAALRPELVVEFTPLDPYGRWAEQSGLVSAGAEDPTLDPDRDSLVNIIECVLGLDPLSRNGSGDFPSATFDGDRFVFSHRLSSVGAHLQPVVEFGTNLVDWQTALDGFDGVEIMSGPDDPDGTPTVRVSFPWAADPRLFVRLAVNAG
jgi:alpha-glucosidase